MSQVLPLLGRFFKRFALASALLINRRPGHFASTCLKVIS